MHTFLILFSLIIMQGYYWRRFSDLETQNPEMIVQWYSKDFVHVLTMITYWSTHRNVAISVAHV